MSCEVWWTGDNPDPMAQEQFLDTLSRLPNSGLQRLAFPSVTGLRVRACARHAMTVSSPNPSSYLSDDLESSIPTGYRPSDFQGLVDQDGSDWAAASSVMGQIVFDRRAGGRLVSLYRIPPEEGAQGEGGPDSRIDVLTFDGGHCRLSPEGARNLVAGLRTASFRSGISIDLKDDLRWTESVDAACKLDSVQAVLEDPARGLDECLDVIGEHLKWP